jgi:alkylation response protein AidB-like acyl-CoA dehydrogenase
VEVRQIRDLTGEAHFNEITFDDVHVDDDALVGEEGRGWEQVTAELAFERSGSERFMSAFPLMPLAIDEIAEQGSADRLAAIEIGKAVAEIAVMRGMSMSIAQMLAQGEAPNQEAAVVKELGAVYEQRLPETVRQLVEVPIGAESDSELGQMLAAVVQLAPTFSLRGGTREIIRGILARGIGLR